MSSATHSASRAMPALPGAHQSLVTSGEAAIFHARACSRPPEPSRRMFMASAGSRDSDPVSGRTKSAAARKGDTGYPSTAGGRDDLLQRRDMAGERAAAGGGGGHRGLRLLADKGLVHRDVAGLGQRLDMGAEIAVGGAGELLQPREFQPRGAPAAR